MELADIWVLVRSSDSDFSTSKIIGEEEFHRMLFADTQRFYPVLDPEYRSRVRGYVSFAKLLKTEISLEDLKENLDQWAGYIEEDEQHERDVEVVTLVKANLLDPYELIKAKAFVQERNLVEGLPDGQRAGPEAAMAGYEVAKQFGVYEGRAFALVDAMYTALRYPQPNRQNGPLDNLSFKVQDDGTFKIADKVSEPIEADPWLL